MAEVFFERTKGGKERSLEKLSLKVDRKKIVMMPASEEDGTELRVVSLQGYVKEES